MSYLSSSCVKRQVFRTCVKLLVQCVIASSIPQAGMDEVALKGVQTNSTPMTAMSAHGPRRVCLSPLLPAELRCNHL
jgi:hypothetical protein